MIGELSLDTQIENLNPVLNENVYVFVSLPTGSSIASLNPKLVFEEKEGITLIIQEEVAKTNELQYEFPCQQITLNVFSSLNSVGLIAKIAKRLSDKEISLNPVSGYFHDHLFVPCNRAKETMHILKELQKYG